MTAFRAAALALAVLAVAGCSGAPPVTAPEQQRGFALPTFDRSGYDGPAIEVLLREIAGTGATWVALTPTWYQDAPDSGGPAPTSRTASDEGVEAAAASAHRLGLKVLLKPHVDLEDGTARGTIAPHDEARWFAAYTTFADHYAERST